MSFCPFETLIRSKFQELFELFKLIKKNYDSLSLSHKNLKKTFLEHFLRKIFIFLVYINQICITGAWWRPIGVRMSFYSFSTFKYPRTRKKCILNKNWSVQTILNVIHKISFSANFHHFLDILPKIWKKLKKNICGTKIQMLLISRVFVRFGRQ